MVSESAKVYTIPTPTGLDFIHLKELQKIASNTVKINWDNKIKLPKITKALNLKAQDVW
jgi:hypothetical protein